MNDLGIRDFAADYIADVVDARTSKYFRGAAAEAERRLTEHERLKLDLKKLIVRFKALRGETGDILDRAGDLETALERWHAPTYEDRVESARQHDLDVRTWG